MNIRLACGAIAAVFALTACGTQGKPVPEASSSTPSTASSSVATSSAATSSAAANSATSSSVATSPVAVPAKGDKPTREFVIGKWGTDGDCTLAIDLRPDGSSDGPFGKWEYSDGVISFPEEPDFKVNVTVIDAKTMQSTNASSPKTSTMTRCP